MITIPVLEIKEFFKRSKAIKPNTVLPILSYIKLECNILDKTAKLVKTSLNTYCLHEIEATFDTDTSILLDERILKGIADATASESINIEVRDGKVILSDSSLVYSFQNEDAMKFPAFPEQGKEVEAIPLSKDVLQSIGIARNFVSTEFELQHQLSFVHIEGSKIWSSNRFVLYHKTFDESFPSILIDPENAAIIGKLESVQYFTSGNYDFLIQVKRFMGLSNLNLKPLTYLNCLTRGISIITLK